MTPSPILKVLSTIRKHRVTCLLMGGQACVFYGAAEFSRDTDLAILADPGNLSRLQDALDELKAVRIAVPPFEQRYLELGLSVHFRCKAADVAGMRVDVMSKMRGLDAVDQLWQRRHAIEVSGTEIDLMSIADLVRAKKTQRDKDWPMLTRLLEADYAAHKKKADDRRLEFWFRELRTPELLMELAKQFPDQANTFARDRPLLTDALVPNDKALRDKLRAEEDAEREADRLYWLPLKRELERLRQAERHNR